MAGPTRLLLLITRAGPLAEGLCGLLSTIPGIEIAGPVDSLDDALALAARRRPTLVLVDLGPFAAQAPAVVGLLKMALDSAHVLLADDVEQQRAAAAAGADAVLLKGSRPSELATTVGRLAR